MTTTPTPKPWERYRGQPNWKDLQPGYAGYLDDEQLAHIQTTLQQDDSLSFWWGYRPSTKRRTEASIRKVAMMGSDESRSTNARLVRESVSRRANAASQNGSVRVTKDTNSAPLPKGRPRKSSWESELVKLSKEGMGCKRIAQVLKSEGHDISHMTVSRRLAEQRG
jgi:hypothetical protein